MKLPRETVGYKKQETFLKYIRLTLDGKADDVANAASDGLFKGEKKGNSSFQNENVSDKNVITFFIIPA